MGTIDNGEYFIQVFQVLYNLYIVISDTEYGLLTEEPIKIAMMLPKFKDEDMLYNSIKTKFTLKEVLNILEWKCDDDTMVV